jgi:hypothetical protein
MAAGWLTVSAQPANDGFLLLDQRDLGVVQKPISSATTNSFQRSFSDTVDPDRFME